MPSDGDSFAKGCRYAKGQDGEMGITSFEVSSYASLLTEKFGALS